MINKSFTSSFLKVFRNIVLPAREIIASICTKTEDWAALAHLKELDFTKLKSETERQYLIERLLNHLKVCMCIELLTSFIIALYYAHKSVFALTKVRNPPVKNGNGKVLIMHMVDETSVCCEVHNSAPCNNRLAEVVLTIQCATNRDPVLFKAPNILHEPHLFSNAKGMLIIATEIRKIVDTSLKGVPLKNISS